MNSAVRAVGRALRGALGKDLSAAYLHGSAVLGGFRWDRSDLDVLALSRGSLLDKQIRGLVNALAPLTYPARGLEFTLMTAQESAAPQAPAPRYQLHVTTPGSGELSRVVDGRTAPGDSDLVLHLAVTRERGVTLFGPPPALTIAAIPPETLLTAMRTEIGWARVNASLEYLVLTCARAWMFAQTRRIASKVEAGEWAAQTYSDAALIGAALARHRGAEAVISRDAAERLVTHVDRLVGSPALGIDLASRDIQRR